jgi:hypothetical protein
MTAGVAVAVLSAMTGGAVAATTAAKVTVGSPTGETPRNHQNEPSVAIDASNPDFLVAGTNDFIDQQPCPQPMALQFGSCEPPQRTNAGVSGVSFSFDRGHSWVQPEYTGWTLRDCDPTTVCEGHFGPIGTLPWYYENDLVSFGDPAVAVGPKPGADGEFSWDNGSRVYYANLATNFNAVLQPISQGLFKGQLGVAVSRLDDPTRTSVMQKASWKDPVLAISRGGTFSLEDKEQVWADNAESSPFFGNAYVCSVNYRALTGSGVPVPVMVASSTDGGDTWTTRQLSGPTGGGASFLLQGGNTGCTIRTDSDGVVYLFYANFRIGTPGEGFMTMRTSSDGGKHWTNPVNVLPMNDMCFEVDPVEGRCVMDGYAGARIDLAAAPSVDIANGAPTGADATDALVMAWSDGRDGLNNEKTLFSWSEKGGTSWSDPVAISNAADRAMYSAPAISPDGTRAYVIYEGPTAPWRGDDMQAPRPYHGVLLTAPMGPDGPGPWSTAYNGPLGDLRGTYPGHDIYQERVGDYVYAAASRAYGVGVWTDARDAAVCDAVQDYRAASFAAGELALPAPWPLAVCPAGFGNTDTWAATTG